MLVCFVNCIKAHKRDAFFSHSITQSTIKVKIRRNEDDHLRLLLRDNNKRV